MIRHNGITVDRARQTITHRGQSRKFPSHRYFGHHVVAFRLWEGLILGKMSRYGLFDHVYGHCSEGGPIAGEKVIDIRLHQWKPMFEKLQLRLHQDKRAGMVYYNLVPIDVV